jgi:hypothetical protein
VKKRRQQEEREKGRKKAYDRHQENMNGWLWCTSRCKDYDRNQNDQCLLLWSNAASPPQKHVFLAVVLLNTTTSFNCSVVVNGIKVDLY